MRAIILAAGRGTRLAPHTDDRPKGMVLLAGRPLLSRQLSVLKKAGVTDIVIVAGYRADRIEPLGVPLVLNPDFERSNMVASLLRAEDRLDGSDDVLVCYGDIVYESRVLGSLLEKDAPLSTTVDLDWRSLWEARELDPLKTAETLKMDGMGNIAELGKEPFSLDDIQGQYMGLIKIRREAARSIVEIHKGLDRNASYDGKTFPQMYMTSFLQILIDRTFPVKAVPVRGGWLEVDSSRDLAIYESLSKSGRLDRLCRLVE